MSFNFKISKFAETFNSESFLPNSERYESIVNAHWARNSILRPACIFAPSNADQVSHGLQYLIDQQIPFQIGGGGHNPNRTWASIGKDGILISTSSLSRIEFEELGGRSVLHVGAGVRFTDIHAFLQGKGVTIAAGNQTTPGVAGFYLGGGVGPYWNRFGYGVNTVCDLEVVLASGDVIHTNETEHPELFWSLKTGLSNYGVVTRISLKTFPLANIWTGAYIIAPPSYSSTFNALDQFLSDHADSLVATASLLSPTKGSVVVSLFYDGPHEDAERPPIEFAAFADLVKIKNTFTKSDWVSIGKASEMILPNGLRRYWSILIISKDISLLANLFDHYHSFLAQDLPDIEGGSFQVLALHQSAASTEKNRTGPWGATEPSSDTFSVLMLATWTENKDDHRVRQSIERVTDEMQAIAKQAGKLSKFVYINDANEKQDSYKTLEPSNLERLREVSRRYDPEGVFQRLRQGGPKLW